MSTKNNPVLGYITCGEGNRASVHQAQRGKGRFLYTRCDCCGCDQKTGAAFQTRLFNDTVWLDGAPNPPANLLTTEKQPELEPKQPVVEPKIEPEWQPSEPVVKDESEPKGFGFGLLAVLAGVGMVVAAGIGARR